MTAASPTQQALALANRQVQGGDLAGAERTLHDLLRAAPSEAQAVLMLGMVQMRAGRPAEAEAGLRQAMTGPYDARTLAALHNGLGWALRHQNRYAEALEQFETVHRLDSAIPFVDVQRAEILQALERHEDALAVLRAGLARESSNPHLHRLYNDLLYRLARRDEYLKSYDRAPATRDLVLGKAQFLAQEGRAAEAHTLYAGLAGRDTNDPAALTGIARMLAMMGSHDAAAAAFDVALARLGDDAELCAAAAEVALSRGDAQSAIALCQRGLRLAPYHQLCIAGIAIALRLMEDERGELLGGYDSLIQVFDLEPPEGFSGMAEFNAELETVLGKAHPRTREYVGQSLRGGTQTPGQLFGAGHDLVQRLKNRIDEAVGRYIAGLGQDAVHPFLARRAAGFHYAGSWSSRLMDRGFHVNHLHPEGWISSCYYVGVPDAVKDETARQGWIKFGEPPFAAPLKIPVRCAIQPAPGRLVLFPSYTWHGTMPFHDAVPRTTIAFDVVPAS